ncbi:RRM domain-containing protein [Plasmodiophora brassicae]|uniref:RRM domain-containing protein n=1 Tax=Plasmodiophora brassicae TaxID=37360 RepID=A0A0G4J127_PLABS|nr:hypothetical protein PBRA_001866 [Plasmodiophora brassicae]
MSPPKSALATAEDLLRREQEQADRDSRTVFASQIHPKATMREIFEFFSQVGRVRDVQCIEDQRTRKFKGIAYIEMDKIEEVQLALALNGHPLHGYPITVQLTQAEKNRAAHAAALAAAALQEQPMRVRVQNLHPDVGNDDLRPFFEPFGKVDDVAIDVDDNGKSMGSAWISFRRVPDAQAAVSALNQLEILGQAILVSMEVPALNFTGSSAVNAAMVAAVGAGGVHTGQLGELDDDAGGGLHLSAQHRLALMQRLQRSTEQPPSASFVASKPAAAPTPPQVPQRVQPSTCVVLKNMFTQNELAADHNLAIDIKEDVASEASKYGRLLHIYLDTESDGHVFLRFADIEGAHRALNDFHGRFFAARQVVAEFVVERSYELRFPGSGKA